MASTFTPISTPSTATGGGWKDMVSQLLSGLGGQQQKKEAPTMQPLNLSKANSGWADALRGQ
jgi:hypothetical protein